MLPHTLGIDFGTSNTAAGLMAGDRPFLIEVEPGKTTLPTCVFFDTQRKITTYGSVANRAIIDGREGRFMRALKSVLGTPLMREERQIAYERLTLIEVVARFLRRVKTQAEDATGLTLTHAVAGRPVKFHSRDAARNDRALVDLAEAYQIAGFDDVTFMYEPEAAALAAGALEPGHLGLIVDIGGGTSDFSIFERVDGETKILASNGVRVGGTDFDKAVSLAHVMPLLGREAEIRNDIGEGTYTAPRALFNDLASWEKIPFQYTPENRRMAATFAKRGLQPELFKRLHDTLELEVGHDIAFAVEAGKIAVNTADATAAEIDLGLLEPALSAPLSTADLVTDLGPFAAAIRTCAEQTVAQADLSPEQISTVVFVGGSSLMHVVRDTMRNLFPAARLEQSEAFTAVATGLSMAAARADGIVNRGR
ncbi:MAG: Hsp70 family protein [Pseudomonadota bacterium]